MPHVTVVIPTRDRRDYLVRTLSSVRAQLDLTVQIVVVDDGSLDGTPEFLAREADQRLSWVAHDRPRGVAAARNAGIERAQAPWVALIDDDDLWSPLKLSEQLDLALRLNRAWVYSSVLMVNELLEPLITARGPDPDGLLPGLLRANSLAAGASSVCIRKDLLDSVGGFDPRFSHFADWDLWIRLASLAPAARCEELHTAYVLHADSMLLRAPEEPALELSRLSQKHHALYARYGVPPSQAALAQWIAARHRLAGQRLAAARLYARSAGRDRDLRNLARSLLALSGAAERVHRYRHGRPAAPSWLAGARASLDVAGRERAGERQR